jgi:hypothetical protein
MIGCPLFQMVKKHIRRLLVVDDIEKIEKSEIGLMKIVVAIVFRHQNPCRGLSVTGEQKEVSVGMPEEGMFFFNKFRMSRSKRGIKYLLFR